MTAGLADTLDGEGGNDTLIAAGGNNTLRGGDGNDILISTSNGNTLYGGAGDDVYRLGPPDDLTNVADTIDDPDGANTIEFNSRVALSGLSANALIGADGLPYLELTNGPRYSVRIKDGLQGSVSGFAFADGTTHTLETLLAAIGPVRVSGDDQDNVLAGSRFDDLISGAGGVDTLSGGVGNDTLDGGAGTDALFGEAGDDRYSVGWGMGVDTATDAGGGVVTFGPQLTVNNVYGEVRGADFFVAIAHTDDGLLIKDYQAANWRVDLGSGQTMAVSDLPSSLVPPTTYQGLQDDALARSRANFYSTLIAQGYTLQGDGTLRYGTSGTATLTQIESTPDGASITRETPPLVQTNFPDGTVQLAYTLESIHAGNNSSAIETGTSNELTIVDAGGGNDVVNRDNGRWYTEHDADGYAPGLFANGGAGNDLVRGTKYADRLIGGAGDDALEGHGGADTYYVLPGEAGYDLIEDEGAEPMFYGGRLNDPLPLTPKSNDFAALEPLYGQPLPNQGHGARAAILPDTVEFLAGVALADLTFSWGRVNRESTHVTLNLDWGVDRGIKVVVPHADDTIGSGVEYFKFADGTRLSMAQMIALAPPAPDFDPQFGPGTAADDVIEGSIANDTMLLVEGNDYAQGLGGNDVMSGGTGDDVLTGGGDPFALQNYRPFSYRPQPEDPRVLSGSFGSGNDVLFGNEGNDQLYGDDGGNLLSGGAGNDLLDTYFGKTFFAGGAGDDVAQGGGIVAMNRGDGQDLASPGSIVSLGGGIQAGDLSLTREGEDLILDLDVGDSLRLVQWYAFPQTARLQIFGSAIETYDLAALVAHFDGLLAQDPTLSNWSVAGDIADYSLGESSAWAYGGALAYQYATTGGFDGLANGELLDVIGHDNFVDGVQHISDSTAIPVISGTPGNDTLYGTDGAERIVGLAGDDFLAGAGGNDVYEFGLGDGVDRIDDAWGLDTLQFGAGITPEMLSIGLGSLLINVGSAGDAVHIEGFDPANAAFSSSVEQLRFADGTQMSIEALLAQGFDVFGTESDDFLEGTSVGDRIAGLGGNDYLSGGQGADTLSGGAGTDTLAGGSENDVLSGGTGADQLDGGDGNDVYRFARGEGQDVIDQTDWWSDRIDAIVFDGDVAPEDVIARNEGADLTLSIRDTTDSIRVVNFSLGGTIQNSHRIDEVRFADGTVWNAAMLLTNTLDGTEGNDTLVGSTLDDLINGLGGNDFLYGLQGSDTLDGGVGADTMVGGTGDDIYVVDAPSDVVTEQLDEGSDTVRSSITHTLRTNVENLILTGFAAINGTGNALSNGIVGNSANNTLNGGTGNDFMDGGAGNDTYVVDSEFDVVTENADEGIDTVKSSVSHTLSANVEKLTLTGEEEIEGTGNALGNTITGNAAYNWLTGGAGNDTLTGGAGADVMVGGADNDIYSVDNALDLVIEYAGEGTDTVRSTVTYTLDADVEKLTLIGTAAVDGAGNELDNALTGNIADNVLTGNAGNDTLNGGAGADTLVGGAGNDTYTVDNALDVVIENAGEGVDTVRTSVTYALGGDVEKLILTGTAAIDGAGNALDNTMTGNAADNVLTGGAGNDAINGAAGADAMAGGLGDDTYIVDHVADVTSENADEGIDTVRSSVTYGVSAHVEKLVLTGAAAIDAEGNDFDNDITGNNAANVLAGYGGNDTLSGGGGADTLVAGDGDDVLSGGGGADTLIGEAGNDTYVVDNALDAVVENDEGGMDSVSSSVTYTLSAAVENLTLTGASGIKGTGNVLDNTLTGNTGKNTLTGMAGNDTLDGGAGIDTLLGGAGDDTYLVDNVADVVTELANEGHDTIRSSATRTLSANVEDLVLTGAAAINGTGNTSANVLTGNAGDNVLSGNAGDDVLDSGAGNDILDGGAGSDVYRFARGGGQDVITQNDGGVGKTDAIAFGADVAVSDVSATSDGSSLTLSIGGTADSISVANYFYGNDPANPHKVDEIRFADGTVWDTADVWSVSAMRAGNDADNLLTGSSTASLLEGRGGNDTLNAGDTSSLLHAGAGDDALTGGQQNDILVGGSGNDTLNAGAGSNVISFNQGDGADTLYSTAGGTNNLSFGGGIQYNDLALSKDGNDLVVSTGGSDSITLKDWYLGAEYQMMEKLQLMLDATPDYDPSSGDPLLNRRVQTFDFLGLVAEFDNARAADAGLTSWQMTNALLQFHLSGSNDAALGGDLAYYYGFNGALSGIGIDSARQVLGAAGFGQEAQTLRPFTGLQEGIARLA